MPHRFHNLASAGSGALVVGGNVWAWVMSLNLGAVASAVTVLVGLVIYARKELAKNSREIAADKIRDDLKLEAEAVRFRLDLKEEQEKRNRASLLEKIARLTELAEAGNRRTEDANQKLHEQRNEQHAQQVQYHADMESLRGQLKIAMRQLDESNARVAEANRRLDETNAKLDAARVENKALNARLDALGIKAAANAEAIQDVTARTENLEASTGAGSRD